MSVGLGKFGKSDQVSLDFCKDHCNKTMIKRTCEQKNCFLYIKSTKASWLLSCFIWCSFKAMWLSTGISSPGCFHHLLFKHKDVRMLKWLFRHYHSSVWNLRLNMEWMIRKFQTSLCMLEITNFKIELFISFAYFLLLDLFTLVMKKLEKLMQNLIRY